MHQAEPSQATPVPASSRSLPGGRGRTPVLHPRRGIRTYLLLLILVTAVPGVLLFLYAVLSGTGSERQRTRDGARAIAQTAAAYTEQYLADTRGTLERLAERPLVRALDPARCDPILPELRSVSLYSANIITRNEDGRDICSAAPAMPGAMARPLSQQPLTQLVLREGRFAVGAPIVAGQGRWVAPAAFPLRDDSGRVIGTVGMPIDLGVFQLALQGQNLPAGARLTLINSAGTVLAHTGGSEDLVGQNLGDVPAIAMSIAGREGDGEAIGIDGSRRIIGFTTIEGTDWHVLASFPLEPVVAGARRTVLRGALTGLVILGGILVLGLVLSRRIERPARRLAAVAAAVRAGDAEARAREDGPRELAQVAAEFNAMLDAQAASERRFRALIQEASDVILLLAPDGRVQYVSPSLRRVLGYDPEALIGTEIFDVVHPDDLPRMRKALTRVAAGERGHATYEFRGRHADGSWRDLEAVANNLLADPSVAAVVVNVRDVTERKLAEQARRAREIAEEANRAKSEFLSRMSHELRTPLNAILGFGQILSMEVTDSEQRESVDFIIKGGRHLLDLINEVLDIARIEAGRLHLSPEPIPVRVVIGDAIELVRPLAAERRIRLESELPASDAVHVLADQQRLKQVLLNLLSNAIKYNDDGGAVTVTCREQAGERLRISVRDTGPGIPPDMLARLFTPFDRLGAEASDVQGTGLGLALSRRLVEAMGGAVGVESTLGEGSTFWIELPLAGDLMVAADPAPDADVPPAPESQAGAGGSRTVLYIEDNVSNVRLIERILDRRPGLRLLTTMQGRLGLDLARQHRPDLILLDLNLPDLPGWEVLRWLQGEAATRATPVIVLSADATPGQIRRLRDAGARAYLTKPIDPKQLLALVDEIFAGNAS